MELNFWLIWATLVLIEVLLGVFRLKYKLIRPF